MIICAGSENYYAVSVMDRLGLGYTGAVRVGNVQYSDKNDVDRVVEGLRDLPVG
jgi:hypothetical protein